MLLRNNVTVQLYNFIANHTTPHPPPKPQNSKKEAKKAQNNPLKAKNDFKNHETKQC